MRKLAQTVNDRLRARIAAGGRRVAGRTSLPGSKGEGLDGESLLGTIPGLQPGDLDDLVRLGLVESFPQGGKRVYRFAR